MTIIILNDEQVRQILSASDDEIEFRDSVGHLLAHGRRVFAPDQPTIIEG